jgi:hypothetical protein
MKNQHRIITRKEERDANEALGFIFGTIIFLPIILCYYLIKLITEKGGKMGVFIIGFLISFFIFYLLIL